MDDINDIRRRAGLTEATPSKGARVSDLSHQLAQKYKEKFSELGIKIGNVYVEPFGGGREPHIIVELEYRMALADIIKIVQSGIAPAESILECQPHYDDAPHIVIPWPKG